MVKTQVIVVIILLLLLGGCEKSKKSLSSDQNFDPKKPEWSFYEALDYVASQKIGDYNFLQYYEYIMDRSEEVALDNFGTTATWSKKDDDFVWYIRTFIAGDYGVVVLLEIMQTNENRSEKILDIFITIKQEGKQPHFGTLWEPVDPPGSQGELPYRLGVYYYGHPDEIKAGIRIKPDYLIDMQDQKLLIHEPSGADEELFLYQDPGPM